MARTHGRIYTSIWADEDFVVLPKDPQRLFVLLITQPAINNCGIVPYVPRRWRRLARDETDTSLAAGLSELVSRRFVVLDENTDELLVRTFIKHDRIELQPKLVISAKKQFLEIASRPIRRTLVEEYPDLFDGLTTEDLSEPLPEPLFELLSGDTPFDRPSRALGLGKG